MRTQTRPGARTLAVTALLALVALPLGAITYTVALNNGNSFTTRYKPKTAPWNESQLLFLTDVGNWIAVDQGDVASVTSEIENKGFGTVLDTTTVELGWAPNIAGTEEKQQTDPTARLLDFLQQQRQQTGPVYNTPQFVDPNTSGGGIPLSYIGVPTGGAQAPGAIPTPAIVPLMTPPPPQ